MTLERHQNLDDIELESVRSGERFMQWSKSAHLVPQLYNGKFGQFEPGGKYLRDTLMISPGGQPAALQYSQGDGAYMGAASGESPLMRVPAYDERRYILRQRWDRFASDVETVNDSTISRKSSSQFVENPLGNMLDAKIHNDGYVELFTKVAGGSTGILFNIASTNGVAVNGSEPSYTITIDDTPTVGRLQKLTKFEKDTVIQIVNSSGTVMGSGYVTAVDVGTTAATRGIQFTATFLANLSSYATYDNTYGIRFFRRANATSGITEAFAYGHWEMLGEGDFPLYTSEGEVATTTAALGRINKSLVLEAASSGAGVENDIRLLLDSIDDNSNSGMSTEPFVLCCDKSSGRRLMERLREQTQYRPKDAGELAPQGTEPYMDGVVIKKMPVWPVGVISAHKPSNFAYGSTLEIDGKMGAPQPVFVFSNSSSFRKSAAVGIGELSETYPVGFYFMWNKYQTIIKARNEAGYITGFAT